MARKSVRPAKFTAQFADTGEIRLHALIKMPECAFKEQVGLQCREPMSRTKHKHSILIVLFCEVAEVRVCEINPRSTAPVSQNARFYVVKCNVAAE